MQITLTLTLTLTLKGYQLLFRFIVLFIYLIFILSMQPKLNCEREHDIMEPNAGPPCEEPQIFECLPFSRTRLQLHW